MNRRRFLTTTLATGIAQLAACQLRGTGRTPGLNSARVVVVGGGFAGVSAARTLKRVAPELQVILIERSREYIACPGSNQVIAGLASMKTLRHDYRSLSARGIEIIHADVSAVEERFKQVVLGHGDRIPYDRLIVAPGIDFRWGAISGYDQPASLVIPHAWRAGTQTLMLKKQLESMRPGGVVVITVPESPYRCPPGPYERASLMAHFLRSHNPRAKLLIIDGKSRFPKQELFMSGWRSLYPGQIEWLSMEQEGVIDHIDPRQRVVHTEFGRYRADVLNVIPPQKAGALAFRLGLTDTSGWCPVDPLSFESTLRPSIHVIGDASIASPMPKSAFSAYSQAQSCSAAIVSLLGGTPLIEPRLINHCYSFLDPDQAISVTGVYGHSPGEKRLKQLSGGVTPLDADRYLEGRYAHDWYTLFMRETFG